MTRDSGRDPARARLAKLIDERRKQPHLRLTLDEVAARAGIHRETLRQIRKGTGNIRGLTATGLEDALEWEHGSIDAILDGGEPIPVAPTPTPRPPVEPPGVPTLEELVARFAEMRRENDAFSKDLAAYLARQQHQEDDRHHGTGG